MLEWVMTKFGKIFYFFVGVCVNAFHGLRSNCMVCLLGFVRVAAALSPEIKLNQDTDVTLYCA